SQTKPKAVSARNKENIQIESSSFLPSLHAIIPLPIIAGHGDGVLPRCKFANVHALRCPAAKVGTAFDGKALFGGRRPSQLNADPFHVRLQTVSRCGHKLHLSDLQNRHRWRWARRAAIDRATVVDEGARADCAWVVQHTAGVERECAGD